MRATCCGLGALLAVVWMSAAHGEGISFRRTQLDDKFRSEGVAVGDFNCDGQNDICAGTVYYAAPDWQMHTFAEEAREYDPHGYSNSFCNFADDLTGDGAVDIIVVDFPGQQTWWFENPGSGGGSWTRHVATPVTNNESPTYQDVDGDGKRELVLAVNSDPANPDGPDRQMALVRPGEDVRAPWIITPISVKEAPGTNKFSHGLGVGDVNCDGRNDVIVNAGWWEAPEQAGTELWEFHAAPLGENCANMYAYDYDGDGDNDVLSSAAHHLGIWLHERTADGWVTHEIDSSVSQTHSMCLVDINSDGLPDFVTGKRWWAHGPAGDPGSELPATLSWWELSREDGKAVWTRHEIDHDSGVGTQFEVTDVNGDGLLDVVIANKKGAFYFEQVRE